MTRNCSLQVEFLVALVFFLSPVSAPRAGVAESTVPQGIQSVLDAQIAAWNHGDIVGFMEGYQRSPDLTYVSNKIVVRGWQGLLDSYRNAFKQPGGIEMGVLALSEENVIMLNKDAAIVWGKFSIST